MPLIIHKKVPIKTDDMITASFVTDILVSDITGFQIKKQRSGTFDIFWDRGTGTNDLVEYLAKNHSSS